jgi:hypothetical protein
MVVYHKHGVNLSEGQKNKISAAYKNGIRISIKLSKDDLYGNDMLALTKAQLNKLRKAENGVQLNLSVAQLKYMVKTGGFLPLLTLIPLIAGAVGAAGGLTGGIASAVSAAKSNAEQARHNREIEEQLKGGSGAGGRTGGGVVSDFIGKVPVLGSFLQPLLQKIGLGIKDYNKISTGGCVCKNQFRYKQIGNGLFIEPISGDGLFLEPWRG